VGAVKSIITLSLALICTVAAAEPPEHASTLGPEPLRLRLEAAVGSNTCINSDKGICTGWPSSFDSQNTGGFGRVGATIFLPGPMHFLAGGLLLDIGGYGSGSRGASSSPSVDFQLAGLLRAFIPLEDEEFEFTIGLGVGLAHWSPGDRPSWTGLTIPVNLGLGYTVYEDIVIGGEVTFMPRLLGGGVPHHIQGGIYVAYTFELSLTPGATEASKPAAP
jgi:hypothetical protein